MSAGAFATDFPRRRFTVDEISRMVEDGILDEDEPVVRKARELAMQHQRVSPSLLQRRLKIGSLKASKIIEILADQGIVGPREEGESRRVLIHSDGSSTSSESDW